MRTRPYHQLFSSAIATLACPLRPQADVHLLRAPYGVSGHWPPFTHRDESYSQTLPHAYICTEHSSRKVTILVLLDEVEKSQEVEW
jgi:hypothetical protein